VSGLEVAQFVNLFLVALLVGNETGTWAVVHPALNRVRLDANVPAEQEVYRRYGYFMPPLMILTIVSGVVVVSLADGDAFAAALAGLACVVAMQVVTFVGNLPLNKRILAASPDVPADEWWGWRRNWDRWHTLRTALNLSALASFILAALI
jgi:uncharacterized membrane protein